MLDLASLVTQQDRLEVQTFDWGTLQWLASAALLPGAEQTFGVCHIRPGQMNPLHYHPNCEELLFVQHGEGRHRLDGEWVPLKPGTLIRIPRNVRHHLVNEGGDEMVTWIAFSSGDRRTVFLE
jgi:oxalate decarboxylase/phosphoglucose isomerase-like protein (cupin superfamily)